MDEKLLARLGIEAGFTLSCPRPAEIPKSWCWNFDAQLAKSPKVRGQVRLSGLRPKLKCPLIFLCFASFAGKTLADAIPGPSKRAEVSRDLGLDLVARCATCSAVLERPAEDLLADPVAQNCPADVFDQDGRARIVHHIAGPACPWLQSSVLASSRRYRPGRTISPSAFATDRPRARIR